jgi:acetolactate synthase-1/2/3 large subunit
VSPQVRRDKHADGVIGQWLDSIPVIYISGQVKFSTTILSCPGLGLRQLGDQEINIIDIVRPVVKYVAAVLDPKEIKRELEKALQIAYSGRQGPVWLDIPINVQNSMINETDMLPSETFVGSPPGPPRQRSTRSFPYYMLRNGRQSLRATASGLRVLNTLFLGWLRSSAYPY